jgi:hypothetical protein
MEEIYELIESDYELLKDFSPEDFYDYISGIFGYLHLTIEETNEIYLQRLRN